MKWPLSEWWVCVVLFLGTFAMADGQASEIWFTPIDAIHTADNKIERLPQFFQLFEPDAPWPQAAAHVQVFKLYINLIDAGDPAKLRQIFKNLRERNMKLAIEFGVLDSSPGVGQNVEGFFVEPAHARVMARRIQSLGGSIDYIAMDEPCWFGADYGGPGAAHWSIDRLADNAVRTMRIIQAVFPDVQVGDIEPVQDIAGPLASPDATVAQYSAFADAVGQRWGRPLAFFDCDMIWSRPWEKALRGLQAAMKQRHVPFGIIYNGSGSTPAEWMADAERHYDQVENNGGAAPDRALFQSWDSVTTKLLPETDPDAHTHLILTYLRSRLSLTASVEGRQIVAVLHAASGQPLARAQVSLAIRRRGRPDMPGTTEFSGSVPIKAVTAAFGARINRDDSDRHAVTADIGTLTYAEEGRPPRTFDPLTLRATPGSATSARREIVITDTGTTLRLIASAGQGWQWNDPARFAVTPGASFQFKLPYVLHGDSIGEPGLGIFFFDARGIETKRILRHLEPAWVPASSATTDANGRAAITLPADAQPDDDYRVDYSGDSSHSAVEFDLPAKN